MRTLRFLWSSGFAWPIIFGLLTYLSVLFPLSAFSKPENYILLAIWQVIIFLIRPALFVVVAATLLVVFTVLYRSPAGKEYLGELWLKSDRSA